MNQLAFSAKRADKLALEGKNCIRSIFIVVALLLFIF